MKKLLATMLCVVMIASMAITANAQAIRLPDGGKIANTGCSQAYGYTDGGTAGRMWINCTIERTSANGGTFTAWITTEDGYALSNNCWLRTVAWNDAAGTSRMSYAEGRTPASSVLVCSMPLTGVASADHGTGGHDYSSTEYGHWICGTWVD